MKVAIVPSNQDKNLTVVSGLNEMEQVAAFVAILASQAPANIEAKVFTPQPESLDTYKYSSLYLIQKEVDAWNPDLAVNIHTDSGYYSHTGTYHDGSEIMQELCDTLCPRLQQYIKGPCARGNYYDYIFASIRAPAILLELGSHQIKQDMNALTTDAIPLSFQIWMGIEMIFGDKVEILEHLDQLWASANQLKETAKVLREQADKLEERAAASYERIIAIKKSIGLE